MRIALTVWNGRIAPLFDVAGTLQLAEITVGSAAEQKELSLPAGAGIMQRMSFLSEHRVSVLICGAVSRQVHRMLELSGIEVFSFISGDVEDVLNAFLSGSLHEESFRMPGCGMGRCRGAGKGAGHKGQGKNRGSRPGGKRGVRCQVETGQDPSEKDPHGESV